MAVYALSLPTTVSLTTAPAWDVKAGGANIPKIMEVALVSGQAVAGTYGLGRPANEPNVVQTGAVSVLNDEPIQSIGQTTCAIQWTVPPTVPTQFHRRAYLAAVIDAAIIWSFPRGFAALPNRGLVLWNIAANPTPLIVHVVLDE